MLKKFGGIWSSIYSGTEGKVLLAVSGGVDSMVLAHLLLKLKAGFAIAHMNFQLRGKESDADEQFVHAWARENKVACFTKKVNAKQFAKNHKLSTQMAARGLRYDWFDELMQQEGFQFLVTAHHADDNLETALYNLAKGTGIRGLAGMLPRKGHLLRPLLHFAKAELLEFAQAEGIRWREDATNASSDYARNKIRNDVIPWLAEINPSISESFKSTQRRLSGTLLLLEDWAEQIRKDYGQHHDDHYLLSTKWMQGDERDEVVLYELLKEYGLNYQQVAQLAASVADGNTGSVFRGARFQVLYDRQQLVISMVDEPVEEVLVYEANEKVPVGNRDFYFKRKPVPDSISQESNQAVLDLDTLTWPLKVRSWAQGDKFRPLGMKGMKLVSDFLIDEKVPHTLKASVLVLESAGQIAWVVGMRIDDRFKITNQTQQVCQVSVSIGGKD